MLTAHRTTRTPTNDMSDCMADFGVDARADWRVLFAAMTSSRGTLFACTTRRIHGLSSRRRRADETRSIRMSPHFRLHSTRQPSRVVQANCGMHKTPLERVRQALAARSPATYTTCALPRIVRGGISVSANRQARTLAGVDWWRPSSPYGLLERQAGAILGRPDQACGKEPCSTQR